MPFESGSNVLEGRPGVPAVTTPYLNLSLGTEDLRPQIDEAVERVLDSGQFIGGVEVDTFEREFAAYCGARYAVGVGSGLDALTLMLQASGIGPGDGVIVPSNTYIATWLAVSAVGGEIQPVEPDSRTFNLDPERVEAAMTANTRAILAVHLYGRAADMEALGRIASRHGLKLFVDAAQAHGIAASGDGSAYSFYPTKNLGALGDAGAVLTDDAELADRIRVLANYGSRQKYFNEVRGRNSRLDPLQAAVLRVKLKYLDGWNQERWRIATRYLSGLAGLPHLLLPDDTLSDLGESVWHVFAIRHPERDRLASELASDGVGTLIHYPQPPHLSAAYRDLGFGPRTFPVAEQIADTELSLPLHPHMTEVQVEAVIRSVKRGIESVAVQATGAAR